MSGRISLRASVFVLALLCVVAAQAISFAILLAFPAHSPPAVVPVDVELAFRSPGKAPASGLEVRRVGSDAPFGQDRKPYAMLVSGALRAGLTDLGVREVRVRSLSDAVSLEADGAPPAIVTAGRRPGTAAPGNVETSPFPSFETAVQRRDGNWTLITPRASAIPPGYLRIAAAFALSALLLAPLAWWTSRRMTLPIRLLADASRALGSNPGAEPLQISGPAEVRDASIAFNAMQASLVRHMDERATLMAAIAHDLRTPLTSLRLRAEAAPEVQRARMAADIARMEGLISDLLLFVSGARATAARERMDLAELAKDVVDSLPPETTVSLVPANRCTILANRSAIRRVLENLIGNAVSHGGGARIALSSQDGVASVEVRDHGPGIPAAELERMFEPFVRLETSRSLETGGVGLGLAIARSIARAHGGDVELENAAGGGLTARLRLPLA